MLMLGLKGLNVVSATNKDALTQSHNDQRIEPSILAARDTSASNNRNGTPMTYNLSRIWSGALICRSSQGFR